MWRNTDVDAFIRWLRRHNEGGAPEEMAGFYGLDLYNLGGSMRAVIDYLDDVDPEAAAVARERYGCLMPYAKNRTEEHTSELQSLMRISYAVFCLKKKKKQHNT